MRGAPPLVFDIIRIAQVGSTNDELRTLAEAGAPHGTVVHAARQTAGRGRMGREWLSRPGNLYASILLRTGSAPRSAAELGFVAALAVADTLDAALPTAIRTALKWPNDVLVGGAKIAGLLLERLETAHGGAMIAGVGVNVAHAPGGLPYPATCLAEHAGRTPAAAEVLDGLLPALAGWLAVWLRDGFAPVRAAWLRRGPAPGALLHVAQPGGRVVGCFEDLAMDGALLLRTAEGTQRVIAGDVTALP